MNRLSQLISKLNEQFSHNADPPQLLLTVKQIEAALLQRDPGNGRSLGTAKIAVLMPQAATVFRNGKEGEQESAYANSPVGNSKPQEPAVESKKTPAEEIILPAEYSYDPLAEVPTLAKQKPREINDHIAVRQSSLNDVLKEDALEVGHLLTEAPVRDLKKAIGINDRFVFIQELFRGDETMYERCVKTINNFRIYAEAEYWIERELNVKLGWDKNSDTAQHFYRIVKRRFT